MRASGGRPRCGKSRSPALWCSTRLGTLNGIHIAMFDTKIYNRLLVPLTAADQPQAPPQLRQALRTLDHHVESYIHRAQLKLDTAVKNLATKDR
jgi:hypothetical protein